ncbi:hypothetical protein QQ008_25285 [Fulvivirgaceae bacterium BMA10]|uniref:Lipoprotein n=1 Tax=Splendidivirga corallicola TaxID=3051826 RepID=A0ABT8KVC8_9BACT|nr:hypothetical protein [Fulvivirgaceae bacterium BMA10]
MKVLDLSKKVIACGIVFSILLASCKDDEGTTQSTAPAIPPSSTFVMDFDDFQGNGNDGGRLAKGNWLHAGLNVLVWNVVITANLAVPVTAFHESMKQTPEFIGDNTWQWTFTFEVNEVEHTAKLQGKLVSNGTDWRMLISKEGEFTDFEWYTGHSNAELTEGTWRLNIDPNDPRPYLDIEWTRNTDNTVASIKYTNVIPADDNNGSYILYGINQEEPFDRFYDIFIKSENNLIEIDWDYETKAGRVKNPAHFSDEAFHCWDGNLDNVDCQ